MVVTANDGAVATNVDMCVQKFVWNVVWLRRFYWWHNAPGLLTEHSIAAGRRNDSTAERRHDQSRCNSDSVRSQR